MIKNRLSRYTNKVLLKCMLGIHQYLVNVTLQEMN